MKKEKLLLAGGFFCKNKLNKLTIYFFFNWGKGKEIF